MGVNWNFEIEEKFKLMISKMPLFQRRIAEKMVKEEVATIVTEKKLNEVSEEVLVHAFFKKVPGPFKGLMKKLLKDVNIDYTKYGYE